MMCLSSCYIVWEHIQNYSKNDFSNTDQKSIEKYGGSKMCFPPPIDYDKVMKKVPYGEVITVGEIRKYFTELSRTEAYSR